MRIAVPGRSTTACNKRICRQRLGYREGRDKARQRQLTMAEDTVLTPGSNAL